MMETVKNEKNKTTTSDAGRTLRIERRFKAPQEVVFQAWTEIDRLVRWWGPKDVTVPRFDAEILDGGLWSATMRGVQSGKEHHHGGKYITVRPHSELEFTWAWIVDGVRGHETIVHVEFIEEGEETVMRFEQQVFATVEQCDLHNEGWTSSFECLRDYVER